MRNLLEKIIDDNRLLFIVLVVYAVYMSAALIYH